MTDRKELALAIGNRILDTLDWVIEPDRPHVVCLNMFPDNGGWRFGATTTFEGTPMLTVKQDYYHEKPILMKDVLVRQSEAGIKTQTRRIVKPPIVKWHGHPIGAEVEPGRFRGAASFLAQCPYGRAGTILWVRQAYIPDPPIDDTWNNYLFDDGSGRYNLRELPERFRNPGHCLYRSTWDGSPLRGWKPSIHMPRWAARVLLRVEEIRLEHVQDISEEDAIAEGVEPLFSQEDIHAPHYRPELDLDPMPWTNYLWHGRQGVPRRQIDAWEHQSSSYNTAVGSFSSLWELINGPRGFGWKANPLVWVVKYKLERVYGKE